MINKKSVIIFMIICIVVLVTSNYITSLKSVHDYKVGWLGAQSGSTVTNFDVTAKEDSLSLFNTDFYVDVTIEGELYNIYHCVGYIHKSEHFEIVDGKKIVIVNFEPIYDTTLNIFKMKRDNKFKENFKYRMKSYDYGDLVYIFKCGDFEKKIHLFSNK